MNMPTNIKPLYFLEVWRSPAWGTCWAMRSFGTVRAFNQWYDYHEHYYGKTATVHVGTNDFEFTREEFLKVATDHVLQNCRTLTIDLNTCTYKWSEGRASTPDY